MKIIDYNDYPTLTLGSLGMGPFVTADYNTAYANILAIQQIIDDCESAGIGHVVFPKAEISLCYVTVLNMAGLIKFAGNTTYDFCGSTWDIIFDSNNMSPYQTVGVDPHLFEGIVSTNKDLASNTTIKNLNFLGEMRHRSFTNPAENTIAGAGGYKVGQGAHNIHFVNCSFDEFVGDGVNGTNGTGGDWYGLTPTSDLERDKKYHPGWYNDATGIINSVAGCYVTQLRPIDISRFNARKQLGQYVMIKRQGGFNAGTNYKENYFDVLFFDASNVFIKRVRTRYMENFIMPANATGIRIQLYNETVGLPYIEENVGNGITRLHLPFPSDINFTNCYFRNNHRGGFSNVATRTILQNCKFFNNGTDSMMGAPIFTSTTRYGINVEDTYGIELTVDNCKFMHNGHLAIAYRGEKCNITNCSMIGHEVSVAVYRTVYVNVDNCITDDTIFLNVMGSSQKRDIKICNNKITVKGQLVDWSNLDHTLTDVNFYNSTINFGLSTNNNALLGSTYDNVAGFYNCDFNFKKTYPSSIPTVIAIFTKGRFYGCKFKSNIDNGLYNATLQIANEVQDEQVFTNCKFWNVEVRPHYAETGLKSYKIKGCTFELGVNNNSNTSSFESESMSVSKNILADKLNIDYIDCTFINTRVSPAFFNVAPATLKEIEVTFKGCKFRLSSNTIITGTRNAMIYSNSNRAFNPSLEKYTYNLFDCVFDLASDVPSGWILMRSFNPVNIPITLNHRGLKLMNGRTSLKLTNNVTV